MKLQRLRLAGFKSFVDPTEFAIEPGLTGVVGPNGCGKSNVLEALRWVMGAASAKALRGASMEDVIFNGGEGRPPRSWAEVTLTLDNHDRTAPAAFNAHDTLAVSRRIDRGGGSTFRVNGREVRARDVQLLFADASTGANSPALVRQGQISELIAARPENRRRILEEAGGVSGLHGRRHEAELRLRAAEHNLERLDDVVGELEAALNRLKREARQAERYRRLTSEIRSLQAAVLNARWSEAAAAAEATAAELTRAAAEVDRTAGETAAAATAAAETVAALPPLRDSEMTAAAILQRLTLERDRLDAEEAAARAEAERLRADLIRIQSDRVRESRIAEDASAQLTRLTRLLETAQAEIAAAPQRLPDLQTAASAAESARAAAEAAVETLAAALAAAEARAQAESQRRADLENRVARSRRALDQAKADRTAIVSGSPPAPPPPPPSAAVPLPRDAGEGGSRPASPHAQSSSPAQRGEGDRPAQPGGGGGAGPTLTLAECEQALTAARAHADAAETARAEAVATETTTRDLARAAEDRQGRLRTEARGLAELLATDRASPHPPALDAITVDPGYEAALAAALGDDLQAALDPAAPRHWSGADAPTPSWPATITPLSAHVRAPAALTASLAHIGLCTRADAPALARTLPPGARLVSLQGDLWRWDGFVARAEAPSPAAIRLEQKARLAALESDLEATAPAAESAAAAHTEAHALATAAAETAASARRALPALERALTEARAAADRLSAEQARRDARLQSLDDLITRFEADLAEAEAALAEHSSTVKRSETGEGDHAQRGGGGKSRTDLSALRQTAQAARESAAQARAALDAESRDATARARRLESLTRDHADWSRRGADAARRVETLDRDHTTAAAAIEAAREAPAALAARRATLLDAHTTADRRRAAAADALAAAESARATADRTLRDAESAASTARESRAAASARAEAAADRLAESIARIHETAGVTPAELAAALTETALALPPGAEGMEAHLTALERQRDAFGGVNLLADEEAKTVTERLDALLAERADLSGAIARLREGVAALNAEGRQRLLAAFDIIQDHFKTLFQALFSGGQAELRLVESDDPLEAGLEIFACPPGKRLAAMSLMSGGEQALTAAALIFAVFLANPAPICVLDEVDAPLDDANVERFCNLLAEMTRRAATPFVVITHNAVTMSRMDRLYGVTMPERGISQLLSVDLAGAERMAAE